MTMFFFPAKLATEMVTVPAAGSTALTMPPTPRFCQSCRSCWRRASKSERFIATTDEATSDKLSSEALPATRMRSPTWRSSNRMGVEFAFGSFSPGATRMIRAVSGTVT